VLSRGIKIPYALYKEELHHWRELGTNNSGEITMDFQELACMNNLGTVYYQMGDYDEARPLLEDAMSTRRDALGNNHPHTMSTISNLGSVLMEIGDHKVGMELLEEAAVSALRVLGPDHPKTRSLSQQFEEWREVAKLDMRAVGTVVGLASRADLNDQVVGVLSFDHDRGRYVCRRRDGGTNIRLKPENLA
jgi:tetratricopeptide (TPR) repeat protein